MYDPDSSLSSYLGSVVNVYDNYFEGYWGLNKDTCPDDIDEETWGYTKLLQKVAKSLLSSARTLQRIDENGVEVGAILDRVDRDVWESDKFVRDTIELDIAWEFEKTLPSMTDNVLKLLDYLVEANGPRTRAYLARVSDCFIRDMKVETIIMCGAALEAALEDLLPEDEAIREKLKIHGRNIYLGDRIRYLREVLNFPKDIISRAFAISQARNDAVHLYLDAIPEPEEAVRNLAKVLRTLENL